jgi:hypothetical protein
MTMPGSRSDQPPPEAPPTPSPTAATRGAAPGVRAGGRRNPSGLRALAEAVDQVARPRTGGRRRLAVELAVAWPDIVGAGLARLTHPDRIAFPPKRRAEGTLHVRVGSGAAALELQHGEGHFCQRINAWLGFTAVARLRLVHAPLPAVITAGRPPPVATPPAEAGGPTVSLGGIDSPRLRATLGRLARRLGRDPGDEP